MPPKKKSSAAAGQSSAESKMSATKEKETGATTKTVPSITEQKDSLGREIANRSETMNAEQIEALAQEFYKVYEVLHDCASFMSLKKVEEIQAIVSGLRKKAKESQKLANSQIGRKLDAMAIELGLEDRLRTRSK
ncbi:hypothetical protein C5Y96_10605 [Blastopirellula marina]|uniref:Uncharacterized protein n=1 Tax=Blastopirellula marina TaxID=124 RepID=A0A2S8FM78_9BACT|nr:MULTISPECIES: hypothetical protein [Pirellulaceae]PQO33293.1 hypothetical protein C5Y96_10605 [Blastopirellula marina]RCS52382.1 hypothetical protein DTL36_10615 [Bremerella cremea]